MAQAPRKKDVRARARKTRVSKGVKILLVAIGCAAMILSVSTMACSGIINQSQNKESYTLTGGVAAKVDGVNITEDTVTKQIMNVRTSGGYDTDKKWAQYLVDNNMTPESYRASVIDSLARQYLVQKAEKEYDVQVTDEDVEQAWKDAAANYDSEEAFESQIQMFGFTKDTYKQQLETSLKQTKLKEKVAKVKDPTDQEVIDYLNSNLSTYNDARRSQHILFKVNSGASDDEKAEVKEKAQKVLDQINAGEISFDDAVSKYSEDTGSKDDKGDVSQLVESSYGYHIIKCTGYFHVDDSVTSIDQVPKKIVSYIKNILKTQKESTAYSEWMDDYIKKADIQINDMPKEVPYNVSLEGVTPSTGSGSSSGE